MTVGLAPLRTGGLGAPGIFFAAPAPARKLDAVRRDVAGFLGVAPRGPARLPAGMLEPDVEVASWLATSPVQRSIAVPVTSWDEYRHHFGGYEGPGRLPYAVSAFFAQGGRRAYVVRVVHDHGDATVDAAARATATLAGVTVAGGAPVTVFARSEGRWGDGLRGVLRFRTRPLTVLDVTGTELVVERREWVPGGSLLRLRAAGDVRQLVFVDRSEEEPEPAGAGRRRVLTIAGAVPADLVAVDVVTAELEVTDLDPSVSRSERIDDIGLRFDHPRWLARVIVTESLALWPDVAWAAGTLELSDPALPPIPFVGADPVAGPVDHLVGGSDRWDEIEPADFFDASWVPGDEVPGDGVQCLADVDIGLLLAPDLYDPAPLAPTDDVADPPTLCGADFTVHVGDVPVAPSTPAVAGLDRLRRDPRVPAELDEIVDAQRQLVDYGVFRHDLTVLLDVPLGLSPNEIRTWRSNFDTADAAAYHPWLDVAAPDDQRDALVRINPSAFAAGIIAERELRLGVQHGPANEIATGAVRVATIVAPDVHDELHVAGINVLQPERDGVRLTAARTLSRRPPLRQLSVARLLTVLRLTLEREMQWAVFEPNDQRLWTELRRLVHDLLRRFFDAGAFAGATTKEAFFVRCDGTTMTQLDLDHGRVVCLVGVAPAEPIEYVILEIALVSDSSVRVEVRG